MLKRVVSLFLVFVFFVSFINPSFANSSIVLSVLNQNQIKLESDIFGRDMRVMVEKDNKKYYYSLLDSVEYFPLQLGSGDYSIKILKNIEGNRYSVLKSQALTVKEVPNNVYLTSSQPVYWKESKLLMDVRKDIFSTRDSDLTKIRKAYNYILTNYTYDFNKIDTISNEYVPVMDSVINDKSGICYDFAAVFAGLLRSEGIQTKLVKGYRSDLNGYHAWNEVLYRGKWVIIDTTYDLAFVNSKTVVSMMKDSNLYEKVREY